MVNNNTRRTTSGTGTGWTTVGSVRKSKTGSFYLKLREGITISLNGTPVQLNDANSLVIQDPRKSKQRLLESGKAKNKEKLKEEIENIPSYVVFDVLAPKA